MGIVVRAMGPTLTEAGSVNEVPRLTAGDGRVALNYPMFLPCSGLMQG